MNQPEITYRGMIYPWQCDHMGHMNVMWYTGKFDEASWQLLARLGFGRSYMREQNCVMAAVQQDTSYKRELRSGDIITIRSRIIEIGEKVISFLHEMRNDETGEIAAVTALTGVHMDAVTRRSRAFPPEFVNKVRQVIEGDPLHNAEIHDTLPQGSYTTDPHISGSLLGI